MKALYFCLLTSWRLDFLQAIYCNRCLSHLLDSGLQANVAHCLGQAPVFQLGNCFVSLVQLALYKRLYNDRQF